MRFIGTGLPGVYLVAPEPRMDERGFFARMACEREFAEHGLNGRFVQCNLSYNARAGTLRGLHYQAEPHPEAKLIRCTRGVTFHVVLDLRRDSPTYKRWQSFHLRASEHHMLYVPEGCANGFQALEDETELFYQMSEFYHPECSRGVRWNDPAFGINWPPHARRVLSAADAALPDFQE